AFLRLARPAIDDRAALQPAHHANGSRLDVPQERRDDEWYYSEYSDKDGSDDNQCFGHLENPLRERPTIESALAEADTRDCATISNTIYFFDAKCVTGMDANARLALGPGQRSENLHYL